MAGGAVEDGAGAPARDDDRGGPAVGGGGGGGERARRVGLALGPVVFAVIAFAPTGLRDVPGYGHRPAYAAATAALMAVWWLTEALPIAVTACVPVVLYPALGVFGRGFAGDLARAASPFTDAYLFLFLGGMAIGAAMETWGLHRRVALTIMRAVGTAPRRLLLGMIVATAFVSLWISNTATAVMMMPIGLALVRQLEAGAGRRLPGYGAAVMLAVAYGSNIGGIGTKIGTATNSIFCGFVARELRVDLSFPRYFAFAFPFVALFVPVAWGVLWTVARRDAPTDGQGRDVLDRELSSMGPPSRNERKVAAVFLAAAALWVLGDPVRAWLAPRVAAVAPGVPFLGKHYEAAVGVAAAVVLALARALPMRSLARVPWSTLVLLGGSFAMAAGIEGSGLARWLAQRMGALASLPLGAQVAVASVGTVALSAVASNTATVNVMLNVLPRSMAVLGAATIASSCDFMLPAGTPPNAIVFGSGYVRLPTMIRVGFALDVAAAVAIAAYAALYVPRILG